MWVHENGAIAAMFATKIHLTVSGDSINMPNTAPLTQDLTPNTAHPVPFDLNTLMITTPLLTNAEIKWCPVCPGQTTCTPTIVQAIGSGTLALGQDAHVVIDPTTAAAQAALCQPKLLFGSPCHIPTAGQVDACEPYAASPSTPYACAGNPSYCGGNALYPYAPTTNYGQPCKTAQDCHDDGHSGNAPVCIDNGMGTNTGYCARNCDIGCGTVPPSACIQFGANADTAFNMGFCVED